MNYRIIQKKAFKVIGTKMEVSAKNEDHHRMIADFWNRCNGDGTCEKISSIDPTENLLGISFDFDENKQFSYMIAIEDVNHVSSTDFTVKEVPASSWAVFPSIGPMPEAIAVLLTKIYQEWFPAADIKQADGPVIEVYFPGDPSASDYKCEVWIPIITI